MRYLKSAILAATVAGVSMAGGVACAAGPPSNLKPVHVAGPGVYVRDLEAQKAWYVDKLGMTPDRTIMRDGKPFEYIMGLGDGADRAVVVLASSAQRPVGANNFVRIILQVADAKGLAGWLKTVGVANREAVPGVAYFVQDPEGNPIELYTPPKP